MGQPIRYADAVRLLGGKGKVIVALDKIMGGLLLGTATAGFGDVLGLIDAKAEAVRLLHELIDPLRDKLAGLNRHSRTECLQAAYATIVMAAFFEALDDVDLPLSLKQLKLTRAEALEISDTEGLKDLQERSEMVFNTLLNARVMTPEIHRPYEDSAASRIKELAHDEQIRPVRHRLISCALELVARDHTTIDLLLELFTEETPASTRVEVLVTLIELDLDPLEVQPMLEKLKVSSYLLAAVKADDVRLFRRARRILELEGSRYGLLWALDDPAFS